MVSVELTIRKHREVARAWRRHDPQQGRIPLAAKKQLASLKRTLAPAAAVIEHHLYGGEGFPDHLLTDCILERGIARQRALKTAHAASPGAVVNGSRDLVDVRWQSPRDHLIADVRHPGEAQSNITVHIALLWRAPVGTWSFWAAWLLEASDHVSHLFSPSSLRPP